MATVDLPSPKRRPARLRAKPVRGGLWLRHVFGRWLGATPEPQVLRRRLTSEAALDLLAHEVGDAGSHTSASLIDFTQAYLTSAVDIASEAEALAEGAPLRQDACAIDVLMAGVADALGGPAAVAGVVVVVEGSLAAAAPRPVVDAARLRMVLRHLLMRALLGCGPGGEVRLIVERLGSVVQISIRPSQGPAETGLHDLGGATRLLYALGAVLVAEPAPGRPVALCIVLPCPEPTFHPGEAAP